ncbi:interleukin-4 [Triplophysa dalaica]|uniref:interleukin-4 n=1 Tax=Triplophysa dalaica TaxID=1582913 RepID=UPI0024DF7A57|nr:interleukin-4 [Triplophysa dalaica]
MRTFLLLVLAWVVVTESKVVSFETFLLQESIDSVNIIIKSNSSKILEQFVKDVFENQPCSVESLCRAAAVLKHAKRNAELNMLRRQLYAYASNTRHPVCTVPNADECPMNELLNDLKRCCQKLLLDVKRPA